MFDQIRAVIETANAELSLRLAPADMDALSERLKEALYPLREVTLDDETINMILRQMPSMLGLIGARPMPEGVQFHPIVTSNPERLEHCVNTAALRDISIGYDPAPKDHSLPHGTALKRGDNGKIVPCDKDDPEQCGTVLRDRCDTAHYMQAKD